MWPYDSPLILTNFGSLTDLGSSLKPGPDKRYDIFFCICGVRTFLKDGDSEGSSSWI